MARRKYPITHWSYSSLISYLRNPLAWHKRYVEGVYDMPSTPAAVVGRAAHTTLQHFYGGFSKEQAVALGLEFLQNVPDFEINFGKATSNLAKKKKRRQMEAEYYQATSFYLARPPRHKVLGVEVKAFARIPNIPIPVKAISDLVVVSRADSRAVDIVDHKFVDSFGSFETDNPLFMVQALFNYYTVLSEFKRPVKRFIVYECRKRKNKNGKSQMRRHVIGFREHEEEFALFHRLLADATKDIRTRKVFLPNPSDMFEGKNSLEIYRWGLVDKNK
ncbi:MAG: PD-(D/E)XK nuclease family protein [Candidatus Campbellbacteria bacterium]|nr:PD-(D/E)XK nuclease family protein [Candidatus Campbellbacteria bacterium]